MSIIRTELLLPDGTDNSSIEFQSNFGGSTSRYVISHKGELYEEISPWLDDRDYKRTYLPNFNGTISFNEENSNRNYTATFSGGRLTRMSYEDTP